MTDFHKKVKTPNGVGYAFVKLPDGKILVSYAWKKLTREYREIFLETRVYIASVFIEEYEEDDIG